MLKRKITKFIFIFRLCSILCLFCAFQEKKTTHCTSILIPLKSDNMVIYYIQKESRTSSLSSSSYSVIAKMMSSVAILPIQDIPVPPDVFLTRIGYVFKTFSYKQFFFKVNNDRI